MALMKAHLISFPLDYPLKRSADVFSMARQSPILVPQNQN